MTSLDTHLGNDLVARLIKRAAGDGRDVDQVLREAVTRHLDDTSSEPTAPSEVTLQPMLHVDDLPGALAVLDLLGAHLVRGSASGDWVKVRLGDAELGLLAHPPNRAQGDESVELTFETHGSLEAVEASALTRGVDVETPVTEFGFGRQLVLRTSDGTRFKVNELRPRIE